MMMRTFAALFLLLPLCACAVRPPVANPLRANAGETLQIRLTAAAVPQTIRALQNEPALNDGAIGIQIAPMIPPRRTSEVQTQAYVAALADARAKAEAIAARLGLTVGRVRGVAEIARSGMGYGYISAQMPMKAAVEHVEVQGPANGVVTLAVTFDAGGTPIAVFGTHAGPPPELAMADAHGIWLTITARGTSFADAAGRLNTVEKAIRAVAKRFGAGNADVIVNSANANSY